LIAIQTIPAQAGFLDVCTRLLTRTERTVPYFKINSGTLVVDAQEKFLVPLPETSRVFYLGTGIAGGDVYRVESSDGMNEVWKVYQTEKAAKMDYRSLKLLEGFAKRPGYRGFRIAHPIDVQGNLLRLEYLQGETVDSLSKDPQTLLAKQVKALKVDYEARVFQTYANLKSEHLYLQAHAGKALVRAGIIIDRNSGKALKLNFHDGNVLVDPYTLQMSLIDPY
jgi:hypothetical protein